MMELLSANSVKTLVTQEVYWIYGGVGSQTAASLTNFLPKCAETSTVASPCTQGRTPVQCGVQPQGKLGEENHIIGEVKVAKGNHGL